MPKPIPPTGLANTISNGPRPPKPKLELPVQTRFSPKSKLPIQFVPSCAVYELAAVDVASQGEICSTQARYQRWRGDESSRRPKLSPVDSVGCEAGSAASRGDEGVGAGERA